MHTHDHLPLASEGLRYAPRVFREKRVVLASGTYREIDAGAQGRYNTTGLYKSSSPNEKLPNLEAVTVLFADCDLCDYMMQGVPKDQATKHNKLATKHYLQALPQVELDKAIQSLSDIANATLEKVTGQRATYTVCSGYGIHLYLWLHSNQQTCIEQARQAQEHLIQKLNETAGFELADTQVKDAGTRVLRTVGSENRKGAIPRPVHVIAGSQTLFDLRTLVPSTIGAVGNSVTGPAGRVPSHPTGISSDKVQAKGFDALFAKTQQDSTRALSALFQECPFFLWMGSNPEKVGLRSWYGAATNIAAVAQEKGRVEFHAISRIDTARYDPDDTDRQYTRALAQVNKINSDGTTGGPWTYKALQENGDWLGKAPAGYKAPAVYAAHKSNAPDVSDIDEPLSMDKQGYPKQNYANLRRIMRSDVLYGTRLKYNSMHLSVEYDGEFVPEAFTGEVQENLELKYKLSFGKPQVEQALYETAYANRYHPIEDYFNSLKWDNTDRIGALLPLMGAEDTALHRDYIRCFLVSTVRRGLNQDIDGVTQNIEGIKVDTSLVLFGVEGLRKSSFFRALAPHWFSDTKMIPGTKDSYLAVTRSLIIEWGEFEQAYGKDHSSTRQFMSAQVDTFRRPYGRVETSEPRRSVIVGTTNQDDFLKGDDRRVHLLPVGKINIQALSAQRDQIWAQAVHLHRQGVMHWLELDVDLQRADSNRAYGIVEPWFDKIQRWLNSGGQARPYTTSDQILDQCIMKPVEQWRRADAQEVGTVLKKLGYIRKRVRINGQRVRLFALPDADLSNIDTPAPNIVPLRIVTPTPQKVGP